MNGIYDEARTAFHAIWTRRWLALAVAWGVCVIGWLVVSQIVDRYEAKARVFMQVPAILPTGLSGTPSQAVPDIDRIRQTLVSAVTLDKVVRGTDLAATVSSDRDLADRISSLAQNIKIESTQDNVFTITTTAAKPKLARDVTQKLIDIFVEQNLAGDRQTNAQSLRFLDQKLAQLQKQLQDADAKRADFQNKYLGSLPGTGSIADRIGATRQQMAQVDGDLASANASLASIQGQLGATRPSIAGAGGVAGAAGPAHARLALIEGQLADARSRGYTDQHPDVVALNAQLTQARAAAHAEPLSGGSAPGSVPNPLFLSLQSMVADKSATVVQLKARKAQLQADLDLLNQKLAGDPQVAAEQGDIERDYQTYKNQYDQLLAQRQQVALTGDAQSQTDTTRFKVIDPPTVPRVPAAPNRFLLLTAILLAGSVAGIGAAFGMAQLRPTFPTQARLERASGMPVIGAIGEVVTRAQEDHRRKGLRVFAGAGAGLAAAYVLLLGVEMLQRGMAA